MGLSEEKQETVAEQPKTADEQGTAQEKQEAKEKAATAAQKESEKKSKADVKKIAGKPAAYTRTDGTGDFSSKAAAKTLAQGEAKRERKITLGKALKTAKRIDY